MNFWENALTTAIIGAFICVVGAVFIAIWQNNKTEKLAYNEFYKRFKSAANDIWVFSGNASGLLENLQLYRSEVPVYEYEYLQMKIFEVMKKINKYDPEDDWQSSLPPSVTFSLQLEKLETEVPPAYFKDMKFLFVQMVYIHDGLLRDSENLVESLDFVSLLKKQIGYEPSDRPSPDVAIKRLSKSYKKMMKKLKILKWYQY
ncbi:hypothetical protein NST21_10340 [Peribacillus sp. FSL K6-1552]|uniref:hypothetical protein n=1 Tax=Peribacillus sp. FSL K6-1552 TaxID=2954514 RepID=UPI0030F91F30